MKKETPHPRGVSFFSCGEEIIYLMFTLEEKLGYAFKNKALLENALQHSS